MDFTSILNSLQGLLANKQGQQTSQYDSNLGLQQQELGQQNSQFNSQLGQQGQEFNANLALQTLAQQQANALAQAQQQQSQQGQQFQQGMQSLDNVVPGSSTWTYMTQLSDPNSIPNLAAKSQLNRLTAQQTPISKAQFTPAGPEWRLS